MCECECISVGSSKCRKGEHKVGLVSVLKSCFARVCFCCFFVTLKNTPIAIMVRYTALLT